MTEKMTTKKGVVELELSDKAIDLYQHVAKATGVSMDTVLSVLAATHLLKQIQAEGGSLKEAKVSATRVRDDDV